MELTAAQVEAAARRIRRVLFVAQGVYSAGFLAAVTLASLVGADLSRSARWAGLPAAAMLAGAAVAAPLWGLAFDRFGRRLGLTSGVLLGAIGTAVSAGSIVLGSLGLYLVGMLSLGGARAAVDQGRYVAGEVHPPNQRARAISTVVLGSTAGAIVGPLLVGPAGVWAMQLELPELAGPYLVAGPVLLVVMILLAIGLRPEPRELALAVDKLYPEVEMAGRGRRNLRQIFGSTGVRVAALVLISAQVIMVGLMVITSLHMQNHDHSLTNISVVITSHTFGMYAFSFVSGWLTDRWGRSPTILAGIVMMATAAAVSGISTEMVPLSLALFMLGVGWNFCYVGGSTLLSDQLTAAERARTQGVTDGLVGAASAVGSLGSGVLFAAVGYTVMGLIGLGLTVVPLLALQGLRRYQAKLAAG